MKSLLIAFLTFASAFAINAQTSSPAKPAAEKPSEHAASPAPIPETTAAADKSVAPPDKNAPPLAKISGYILLVVGFLGIRIAVLAAREAPKRLLILQAEIIAVITPIVAMEVMSDVAYGHAGLAIALLPLLLIAYTMRREMRIAERNAELVRRNRELSILTESATSVLLAETEGETIRQIVALLTKLARLKAAAVVTWDVEPVSGSPAPR